MKIDLANFFLFCFKLNEGFMIKDTMEAIWELITMKPPRAAKVSYSWDMSSAFCIFTKPDKTNIANFCAHQDEAVYALIRHYKILLSLRHNQMTKIVTSQAQVCFLHSIVGQKSGNQNVCYFPPDGLSTYGHKKDVNGFL